MPAPAFDSTPQFPPFRVHPPVSNLEVMNDLKQRLAKLSPEKRELLLRQLQRTIETSSDRPQRPPLLPRSGDQPLPLSFAQQRLWFLSQIDSLSSAYHLASMVELTGDLDESALQQALQILIDRHDILRTQFVTQAGEPIQIIVPQIPLPFQTIDLQQTPALLQPEQVQTLAQAAAQEPFDLSQGPLLRLVLFRLADRRHVLLVAMHHIVSDAWSMAVFIRELTCLYQAICQGQPQSLPQLPLQYGDFALWQRQWLQGELLEQQLNYWERQLADLPPLLELPTDLPRPSMQSFRGNTHQVTLSGELLAQLKQLSRQTNTTLFMVLEAAFALLLSRLSRQTDIALGMPIANRTVSELEPLIGFFINTLVLRNDLTGNPTFLELLQRVQSMTLEAYRYQDVPFESLVERLRPARTLSYSPLFQVMFGLQNMPTESLQLPDLTLTPLPLPVQTAKFDLTLLMSESADGLEAVWEYSTDLFQAETIARWAGHFQTLLQEIVARPQVPMSQLSLLSATEIQTIVYDWNATSQSFPEPHTLHQLFEAQVVRTPDAVALIYEDQRWTYQQVNDRANQLAYALIQLGVTSETLVGVCVERSPEMVIGLYAILKAGGAYVPLDPSYPSDRLLHMITDADLQVLLTESKLVASLPQVPHTLCLDQSWETFAAHSTQNPWVKVSGDQLAYIIYTSGSTGKPKGVMITHRAAVNTIVDINQRFQISPIDRVLGLASLSFDLSVYDIFGFLAVGAALVIPHAQDALNPERWLTLMHQEQVSLWNTAPAVMEMLISFISRQSIPQSLPESLRVVMMSGDAIALKLPEQIWQYGHRNIQVYSFGGATEGSIWSIYYPIPAIDPQWTNIPYGYPLTNQRFHILDAALNPVPIGVPGELHIGGDGVALGYFNRPDLNSTRFVADPFYPEARLYKTGDLGRYLPDGTIQFLGRIDNQVKIRGFRIELGEIESALIQLPQIREALVMVREDQAGDRRLCGYVVPHGGGDVSVAELREALRQQLPDYMVPASILILDQFPLTSNGKVDRRALPAPTETERRTIVAPQTELEQKIAAIWQAALQVPSVGIYDNFFDLGGHSLLMVQIHSQLQAQLEASCSIVDLFQYPTIAALAKHLQSAVSPVVALAQVQQRTALRTRQRHELRQQRYRRQGRRGSYSNSSYSNHRAVTEGQHEFSSRK